MLLLQTCYTHAIWEVCEKCNDNFICLASQSIVTENILASKTSGIYTHIDWVYPAASVFTWQVWLFIKTKNFKLKFILPCYRNTAAVLLKCSASTIVTNAVFSTEFQFSCEASVLRHGCSKEQLNPQPSVEPLSNIVLVTESTSRNIRLWLKIRPFW